MQQYWLQKLTDLESDENLLSLTLVEAMINMEAHKRPQATAVLKHPLFWDKAKILAFFQDVSDRVEKESDESLVLSSLEFDSSRVVREDWRQCIDWEVAHDLRKYRNYRGNSVRDLLRALRNKVFLSGNLIPSSVEFLSKHFMGDY
uniref:(California timema) hypothetical protein n=1 Tax=Timema californicum TaxID=61474 RepID=A0A7R9PA11_TIMCA|nr:unnamed protein product [Timema californicum]